MAGKTGGLSVQQHIAERKALTIRDQVLEVDIDKEKESVTYLLREGSQLIIKHPDQNINLSVGVPVSIKLTP